MSVPADITLDPVDGPEAYLFQCRHRKAFVAYAEMHRVAGPVRRPARSHP